MNNSKAGLGAVETGTLLNRLATDVFLAGVSTEAHRAMQQIAEALGEHEQAAAARAAFEGARANLNRLFLNRDRGILSFALTEDGRRSDELTVWPAVPILLGLIDPDHASQVLEQLAGAEISSDWGARMLTNASSLYDPISYNNGAVWPFLTGMLSWAEYRNHRPAAGFSHWVQNAHLASVGGLGFVPELLSGDFYAPMDAAVPHQLFSSGGVITPLVKGMLGYYPAVASGVIRLEPHLPCRWAEMSVRNLKAANGSLDLRVVRAADHMAFRFQTSSLAGFKLQLSPGFEPGARVRQVALNGKPVVATDTLGSDTHSEVEFLLSGSDEVRFDLSPGLQVIEPMFAPASGDRTNQLKILRVSCESGRNRYTLEVQGRAGKSYSLALRPPAKPSKVAGAEWKGNGDIGTLVIDFQPGSGEYARRSVAIEFASNPDS